MRTIPFDPSLVEKQAADKREAVAYINGLLGPVVDSAMTVPASQVKSHARVVSDAAKLASQIKGFEKKFARMPELSVLSAGTARQKLADVSRQVSQQAFLLEHGFCINLTRKHQNVYVHVRNADGGTLGAAAYVGPLAHDTLVMLDDGHNLPRSEMLSVVSLTAGDSSLFTESGKKGATTKQGRLKPLWDFMASLHFLADDEDLEQEDLEIAWIGKDRVYSESSLNQHFVMDLLQTRPNILSRVRSAITELPTPAHPFAEEPSVVLA